MRYVGISVIALLTTGCFGELWAIRTIDDIRKSEYRAELQSAKTPEAVTRCMMERLHEYQDAKGNHPYAEVAHRDIGRIQELSARSPRAVVPGWYDAGGELLLLIENGSASNGVTSAKMWVHQYMLSPSPSDNLNAVKDLVKGCL